MPPLLKQSLENAARLAQRTIAIAAICSLLLAIPAAPAIAKTCRTVGEQQICLISVKRSAKNYWEYRAVVEIDGDRRPLEVYDCRHRQRTTADGRLVKFTAQGAGPLICRLLYR